MKLYRMKSSIAAAALVVALVPWGTAGAVQNSITPSTNDLNRTNGWAHVNEVGGGPGYIDLEFVSTRGFLSCFEYRSDGAPTTDPRDNFNPAITDGLWPFVCVNNSTENRTLEASQYVEIRMVFGAESDERFDWTRFDVEPLPTFSCEGFLPPADRAISVKRPNRVLPLRMTLLDDYGMSGWDLAPPVVNVDFEPANGDPASDLEELTYAGRGDEGNQFFFDGTQWAFNLSTKGFSPGVYTITAKPGSADYAISPTCEVTLTVQ